MNSYPILSRLTVQRVGPWIRQQAVTLSLTVGTIVLLGVHSATAETLFVSHPSGVYQYSADGTGSLYATGIFNPIGMAFDASGNLFVSSGSATVGTGNIFKITRSGVRTTFATGLSHPYGLAFDASGNLFEADKVGGKINKFLPNGSSSVFASGLSGPSGVAFDANGNLFDTDFYNGVINKFTPGGAKTVVDNLLLASGIDFDSAGNLFVVSGSIIYKYAPGGTRTTFANGLNSMHGLAVDENDNIFVADAGAGTIYKFTPNGVRSTFASGLGELAYLTFATVPEPSSLVLVVVGIAGVGVVAIRKRRNARRLGDSK